LTLYLVIIVPYKTGAFDSITCKYKYTGGHDSISTLQTPIWHRCPISETKLLNLTRLKLASDLVKVETEC